MKRVSKHKVLCCTQESHFSFTTWICEGVSFLNTKFCACWTWVLRPIPDMGSELESKYWWGILHPFVTWVMSWIEENGEVSHPFIVSYEFESGKRWGITSIHCDLWIGIWKMVRYIASIHHELYVGIWKNIEVSVPTIKNVRCWYQWGLEKTQYRERKWVQRRISRITLKLTRMIWCIILL